ncbi:MAG: hypothetical protein NT010_03760 [Proteobacteria bacterium]|nr:hypothetical protein [Pseudomonadota bacterium]
MNKGLPFLIIISCGFWCIFEVINVRIQNWFYINLPSEIYQRYTGYLLAYGTVIPSIYVTKELIFSLIGKMNYHAASLGLSKAKQEHEMNNPETGCGANHFEASPGVFVRRALKTKPICIRSYPVYSILLGLITILLTCLYPIYCFPLVWVFLALTLDGYNYLKGYASFMKDFKRGLISNTIATILSGLLCGILWETWNFWSVSKWVYTVPFFEDLKLFEMPVPGYIGFLVFSFEVVAFLNFLEGIKLRQRNNILIALSCLIFSVFSFVMIDKHTVFSYATKVEKLTFIEKEKLTYFIAKGVKTSYGIDQSLLDKSERDSINLLHLKGMGMANFLRLQQHGINNINALSMLDDRALSNILHEGNLRRMRVYIKAAKKAAGGRN